VALTDAVTAAGGLADVAAIAVGGQQHGMVCLDEQGDVVRDALLWNDVRSAAAARDLIAELGDGDETAGRRAWADAVGLVPVASFTAAKLRWLADVEPVNAERTAAVCLPHDWLTWRLSEETALDALTTDRSDASGTAYWSARTGEYRLGLLERACVDAGLRSLGSPAHPSPWAGCAERAPCSAPGRATTPPRHWG
jgi:xylulokinase